MRKGRPAGEKSEKRNKKKKNGLKTDCPLFPGSLASESAEKIAHMIYAIFIHLHEHNYPTPTPSSLKLRHV